VRTLPLLAVLALTAACARPDGAGSDPDELLTTRYPVTVLDDGAGAELCLGGMDESFPPQCGGPAVVGWEWVEHEGDYDESGGTRWGAFLLTGTYDGTSFTPASAVPGSEVDPPAPTPVDFSTPCPVPDGGWRVLDPASTTLRSQDATMRAATRLPAYAEAWVDQSINPAWSPDGTVAPGDEELLNDPTRLVVKVRVTEDAEGAERTLRETWGGALCVTTAEHTHRELVRITDELLTRPDLLSAGPSRDAVALEVVRDDGSLQRRLDEQYGAGTVVVTSALVPAVGADR
jgi:hypothetical protein